MHREDKIQEANRENAGQNAYSRVKNIISLGETTMADDADYILLK